MAHAALIREALPTGSNWPAQAFHLVDVQHPASVMALGATCSKSYSFWR